MRCRPNEICIVIGEVRGCEVNIGAHVRVLEMIAESPEAAWTFEDASRPVKMVAYGTGDNARWVSSTASGLREGVIAGFYDRHLLPVRGLDEPEAKSAPRELVAS